MNVQPIVDLLCDAALGTVGVDLFREQMPAMVTKGILVLSDTPIRIHPYVINYRTGQIQVVARDQHEDLARETMNSVIETLTYEGEVVLGELCFKRIYPVHEPLVYPRSEGDLFEASVNFDVIFIT